MKACFHGIFLLVLLASLVSSFRLKRAIPFRNQGTLHAVSERTRAEFARSNAITDAQTEGAGGSSSIVGLERLDDAWRKLRGGSWRNEPKPIVFDMPGQCGAVEYDVAVCGGTLGIMYAYALQLSGKKVCVVERGEVAGRPQEWNVSVKELKVLQSLGILTAAEIDEVIAIKFNPVRVGFKTDTSAEAGVGIDAAEVVAKQKGQPYCELETKDVLNLGVRPDKLISIVLNKFLVAGGVVFEGHSLTGCDIHAEGAKLTATKAAGDEETTISAKLVLDCMGNGSPMARQIRGAVEPDGVCIVVGGCARGFQAGNNTYSDLIYTDTPITTGKGDESSSSLQYFWEAFPAGSGPTDRTTYLFTYMDAANERPSVAEIFDDYWKLLPRYQGVDVAELQFQRLLYGVFPTYRNSPLKSPFARLLAVGDASGIQSPLSFGGFGSLTRHLPRVLVALNEALDSDDDVLLSAENLSLINPYQPNLSACWMFQRAMSCPIGTKPKSDLVVGVLANSFTAMKKLGDSVSRPFLQDVLQFGPLLRTLTLAAGQDLLTPLKVVPHVGLPAMLDFFKHFTAMGIYTLLHTLVGPILLEQAKKQPPLRAFRLRRMAEAWKFGSGMDYYDHE